MEPIGSWFAVSMWEWGWRAGAFLFTWILLGLVVGWVVGGAAKLGGPDEK